MKTIKKHQLLLILKIFELDDIFYSFCYSYWNMISINLNFRLRYFKTKDTAILQIQMALLILIIFQSVEFF